MKTLILLLVCQITNVGQLESELVKYDPTTPIVLDDGNTVGDAGDKFRLVERATGENSGILVIERLAVPKPDPNLPLRYPDGYGLLLSDADSDPTTRKWWLSDAQINHPQVKFILHRVRWKHLEPSDNKYVFGVHAEQLNRYRNAGKSYGFLVMTGEGCTPDWIKGKRVKLPETKTPVLIPWGSDLANQYSQLMHELARMQVGGLIRMCDDTKLCAVPITGPTLSASQEMFAVGLDRVPHYTPEAMRIAYRASMESIKSNFPNVCAPLAVALKPPTDQYAKDVIADARRIFGPAAAFQHNALSAKPTLKNYNLHKLLEQMSKQGDRVGFELLCDASKYQTERFGSNNVMDGIKQGLFGTYFIVYPPDFQQLQPLNNLQPRTQRGLQRVDAPVRDDADFAPYQPQAEDYADPCIG